jgi:hypothetical protein
MRRAAAPVLQNAPSGVGLLAAWATIALAVPILPRGDAFSHLVLFLSDKYGFANYYFLVQALALVAAGVALAPPRFGALAEQPAE